MNRFKFKKKDFKDAISFIKNKKGNAPNWAKKDGLSVKNGKIYYNNLQIIAEEDVDSYLRKNIYDKESTTPFGRDSAFHIIKSKVLGVPRRVIMEWLRKQKTLGETRAALPVPKRKKGPKLGKPTFEVDLVFIRKDDLINSNPRFDNAKIKEEQYICSCVEKTSGMCKLNYTSTKEQNIVTPLVKTQIAWLCKRLHLDPKKCALRMDKGQEFSVAKLKELVPDTKNVPTGTSIEKKNQQLQQSFYRILKNRQAVNVKTAIKKSQVLCNQTVNRFHKKTPNEIADNPDTNMKEILKVYNKTRKSYIKGDNRKPFTAGEYVRIQIKDPKAGAVGFKSYKNKTFTERVFVIKKVTKKSTPPRYYVNGRWYTQDLLLKSAPRDQKSEELINSRIEEQKVKDAEEEAEKEKEYLELIKKNNARKKELRAQEKIMNLRKDNAEKVRQKLADRRKESAEVDKHIDKMENAYQKRKKHGKKKRKKYFSQAYDDPEWKPGMKLN